MSFKSLFIGLAMVATGSAVPACAAQYLTNGSFESGDVTGWTATGDQSTVFVVSNPFTYTGGGVPQGAQDGNNFVIEGPVGADAFLSQTFADTAGQTLSISGWVTGDGSSPSDVQFLFNGAVVGSVNPVPDQIWTQYVFTASATGLDTFAVGFRNDNSFDGLDNFSVSSISAVPEPTTWILLLLGFATLGFFRYRRSEASKDALTV